MSRVARATTLAGVLAIAAAAYLYLAPPSTPSLPPEVLAEVLPVDPAVTTGTLDNGLRYYVRANSRPENRIELRLVVNAGSILEDDDQRGAAHFVEHMAFNGTRRFPGRAVGAFLESIGMRFGPSINATTGFDETVYALQLPADDPDVLDRALLILEEWAQHVTFDPAEVEQEKGVILEEWRLRRGAAARLQDTQLPVLLAGSRYAERLPIGTPDSITGMTPDRLRRFYTDWYRPGLMAVIAVGDVRPEDLAARIRERFAGLAGPASPRPRPVFDAPLQDGTVVSVATDREATAAAVSIHRRIPAIAHRTAGDYRQEVVERMVAAMIAQRLAETAQRPDAPYFSAGAARGPFLRTAQSIVLTATTGDAGVEAGLEALATESARLVRFGFTAGELDRQKTQVTRAFERALAEKDNRPSATLAAEYTRNVTIDEPFPGLEYEIALTNRLLPTIDVREVSAIARRWLGAANRIVLVNAPDRPGARVPSEVEVRAAIDRGERARVSRYVFRGGGGPLLEHLPDPGTITRVTSRPAFGITEWRLSNGARVVLEPTTFREDEVLFRATAPGGTSLASDEDFIPAQTAVQIVTSMGFGRFASADLRRALTGRVASVTPLIGPYEQMLTGGGSPHDLETLFQLIHLAFTEPRRDPAIFEAVRTQARARLASQEATPDYAFAAALAAATSNDHPRTRLPAAAGVDQMDLDRSLAFYRERFADAGAFTFVFVGSFDLEAIQPLVERYLASLPATHRGETWRDVGVRPPRGVVERRVEKGLDAGGRVALAFTGPFSWTLRGELALAATGYVLELRLREALREQLGGTYGVDVTARATTVPAGEYSVAVTFGGDPGRLDALVTRAFEEIRRLQASGPTAQEVADVVRAFERDWEANSRQNAFVLGQLAQAWARGQSVESVFGLPAQFKALTPAVVRDTARQYLDLTRYVKVTLVPEQR